MKLFANKRELLAKVMCQLQVPSVLRMFSKGQVAILNYHRIFSDSDALESVAFDSDVFSCSASQFEAQVQYLQSIGRILTFDEYLYWLRKGEGPKEFCTLLTFDDGYIDNYQIAFPILKSHNASACFFVPTGSIEDRQLGWWDIISYIVKNTGKKMISMNGPIRLQLDIERLGKDGAIRQILGEFKTDKPIDADAVLEDLSTACAVEQPSYAVQSDQLMTVDNLVAMRSAGMEIGGHAYSHKVLGQLGEREQEHEIGKCTEMLDQWIGEKIRAFAYPVGLEGSYSEVTKSLVSRFGYEVAFNFLEKAKAARFDQSDKFDIDRLAIYRPTTAQFELLAHGMSM